MVCGTLKDRCAPMDTNFTLHHRTSSVVMIAGASDRFKRTNQENPQVNVGASRVLVQFANLTN